MQFRKLNQSHASRYIASRLGLPAEDGHASRAVEQARTLSQTMAPGHAGQEVLCLMGRSKSNDVRDLQRSIDKMGYTLQADIKQVSILTCTGDGLHPVIPMRNLLNEIVRKYPNKIFAGCQMGQLQEAMGKYRKFWRVFKQIQPQHPVYSKAADALQYCIPCRVHADEGTGLRKTAVFQVSWGPLLCDSMSSFDRYFFWACMLHEQYKDFHAGFEGGNAVIDSLLEHFAAEARSLFDHGFKVDGFGTFFLIFVSFDGDLPAQAKVMHCKRSFASEPNPMCFWCQADDALIPYTDVSANAAWRLTVNTSVPWSNAASAMLVIPGAATAMFMSKDLFHICHLGIVKTFVVSTIAFLVFRGHFVAGDSDSRSRPALLREAYRQFKLFCSKILHETPHVKMFTQQNLNWMSLSAMPEASFKASDVRLMLKWLVAYFDQPFQFDQYLCKIRDAACAIDNFLRACFSCDRVYFTRQEAKQAQQCVDTFLACYADVARKCYDNQLVFYNLTPKYHYLAHISYDIQAQLEKGGHQLVNPALFATQMAEDYVGRTCVMSRTTHQASAVLRTAQKWLVEARLRWNRMR